MWRFCEEQLKEGTSVSCTQSIVRHLADSVQTLQWYMYMYMYILGQLTRVSCFLHGSQQWCVDRVKCNCERTVNDATVHVGTKVQFTDVVVL